MIFLFIGLYVFVVENFYVFSGMMREERKLLMMEYEEKLIRVCEKLKVINVSSFFGFIIVVD